MRLVGGMGDLMRHGLLAMFLFCSCIGLASPPVDAATARGADLALSLSIDIAGGGPEKFATEKLVGVLFGGRKDLEVGRLRKTFGEADVASFFQVSDYAVPDAMKIVQDKNMALPDDPSPSPENGKALAGALYQAALDKDGHAHAETLLDHLLSRPVRDQLVADIDRKFGSEQRRRYFAVLTELTEDLHTEDLHTAGAGGVEKR